MSSSIPDLLLDSKKSIGSRYTCVVCSAPFSFRKNLFSHLCKVHDYKELDLSVPKSSKSKYEACEFCNMVFTNMKEHKQVVHGIIVDKKQTVQKLCPDCGTLFSTESAVKKHQQRAHSNLKEDEVPNRYCKINKSRIKCPECKIDTLKTYNNLVNHLSFEHKIDIEYEELCFSSFDEFEKWKADYEDTHYALYSKDCSPKSTNKKGKRFIYYNCHRSYEYRRKGKPKKIQKLMGSNKISYACPSHMKVIVDDNNNTCTLHFWKTHVGHSTEIYRCKLRKDMRAEIASKIEKGDSVQNILEETRNSLIKDRVVHRVHLLTRKDIYNISRDYNIDYIRKQDDCIEDVTDWVKNISEQSESPVIYFKNMGESNETLRKDDFVLVLIVPSQVSQLQKFGSKAICVDVIQYDSSCDFHLYIIMTVDVEFKIACAVAFCVSNRVDGTIFHLFFEQIKNRVGEIKTSVFICNQNPSIYKAWVLVMSEVPHYLWSEWHVIEDWKIQAEVLISNSQKQELVENILNSLQMTDNIDRFRTKLAGILHDFSKDAYLIDFYRYFIKRYANFTELWGTCFRSHMVMDITAPLCLLHSVYKQNCLRLSKRKPFVKGVVAIIKLACDHYFQHIVKATAGLQKIEPNKEQEEHSEYIQLVEDDIVTGTSDYIFSRIIHSHNESRKITRSMIIVHKNEWIILSSRQSEKAVTVVKLDVSCQNCDMRCSKCNICIHEFKCSCEEFLNNITICIHIHACVRFNKNSEGDDDINRSQESMVVDSMKHDAEILNTCNSDVFEIMYTQDEDHPKKSFFDELKHKTNVILALSEHATLSDKDQITVLNKVNSIIEMFNGNANT